MIMNNIYIFDNGIKRLAKITKMFDSHGVALLEGKRLDFLNKIQLIVDSTSSTFYETGLQVTKANNISMISRAAIGGALLGGGGAVVGALTAKKTTEINTKTEQVNHVELALQLEFSDGGLMYVVTDRKESFYWLMGYANCHPLTDEQIESDRVLALQYLHKKQLREQLQMIVLSPKKMEILVLNNKFYVISFVLIFLLIFLNLKMFFIVLPIILIFNSFIMRLFYGLAFEVDRKINSKYKDTIDALLNAALQANIRSFNQMPFIFKPLKKYSIQNNKVQEF